MSVTFSENTPVQYAIWDVFSRGLPKAYLSVFLDACVLHNSNSSALSPGLFRPKRAKSENAPACLASRSACRSACTATRRTAGTREARRAVSPTKKKAAPGTHFLRPRNSSRKARPPGTAPTLTESPRPQEKSTIRTRRPAPTKFCPCRPEYVSRTCATAEAWCCASTTAGLSWPTAWSISPAREPDGLASKTPGPRASASRLCPDGQKKRFFSEIA